jgi:hypothetical protein
LEIIFGILSNLGSFGTTRLFALNEPLVVLALKKALFEMDDIPLLNEVFRLSSTMVSPVFSPPPQRQDSKAPPLEQLQVDHWLSFFASLDVLVRAITMLANVLDVSLILNVATLLETLRYYSSKIEMALWVQTDYVAVLCALVSGDQKECISSSGRMAEVMGIIESVADCHDGNIIVVKRSFTSFLVVAVDLIEDFDEAVEPVLNIIALCLNQDSTLVGVMRETPGFKDAVEQVVLRNGVSTIDVAIFLQKLSSNNGPAC